VNRKLGALEFIIISSIGEHSEKNDINNYIFFARLKWRHRCVEAKDVNFTAYKKEEQSMEKTM